MVQKRKREREELMGTDSSAVIAGIGAEGGWWWKRVWGDERRWESGWTVSWTYHTHVFC